MTSDVVSITRILEKHILLFNHIFFFLQTLLYGEKYPCDVGKLTENIPKNRFKTTFPCVYTLLKKK